MFTHEQLFYIFFGNMYCSSRHGKSLADQFETDEHSADLIRILGTTQNSKGFREAFNCPVKEPVCQLW